MEITLKKYSQENMFSRGTFYFVLSLGKRSQTGPNIHLLGAVIGSVLGMSDDDFTN